MNIFGKPIDQVNEEDIRQLVQRVNLEPRYFDFKEALNSDNQIGVMEQVVSFANSQGGMILYGIKEEKGEVDNHYSITGIKTNIDNLKLQMENTMRDRIKPRIPNIQIHPVKLSDDLGYVLIIYVPRSYRAPHVVDENNKRFKFYTRNSAGKHPCDIEEVRQLFLQSEDFGRKARSFIQERLDIIRRGGVSTISTHNTANLVLHIIPIDSLYQNPRLELKTIHFSPFGVESAASLFNGNYPIYEGYNIDGKVFYSVFGEQSIGMSTQLFRNGIIEGINTIILNLDRHDYKHGFPIDVDQFVKRIYLEIIYYLNFLQTIGIQGPFLVSLNLQGVKEHYLIGESLQRQFGNKCFFDRDDIQLPEILIEGYEKDLVETLTPMFDALCNAAGSPECPRNYIQSLYECKLIPKA